MENRAAAMREEWVELKRYGIPPGEYVVTRLLQDSAGTDIRLESESHAAGIFFDGFPLLLRNTDSNGRMRTWSEAQLKYRNKSLFRYAFFFEVKGSALIDWCMEEGCGLYDATAYRHYCIVTANEVIDIVASFEPAVTVTPL